MRCPVTAEIRGSNPLARAKTKHPEWVSLFLLRGDLNPRGGSEGTLGVPSVKETMSEAPLSGAKRVSETVGF